MLKNSKVVVVDDNEKRRQNLQVILEFLGESVVTDSEVDWQQQASSSESEEEGEYVAVIIGSCPIQQPIEARIQSIAKWSSSVAIIIMGDENEHTLDVKSLNSSVRQQIIATLASPPTYSKLIDTLYRAQCFHESALASQKQPLRRPPQRWRHLDLEARGRPGQQARQHCQLPASTTCGLGPAF